MTPRESALPSRITETLGELGPGFAFVNRQVHFDVDGDEFYVDVSAGRKVSQFVG